MKGMEIDTSVIERNGKVMLLAYDQGFEHGPVDFNEKNVDPEYIVSLADSGFFTGVIFQEGVAAKYYDVKKHKTPLIIKLNGKTSYQKGRDPLSLQLCTVEKAIELGAKGIGYTIYVGSEHEEEMMVEFSRIEDEAHKAGLVVIAWMYPRGEKVKGKETDKETVAYAARLGMELNADFVKVPYTGDKESFEWVVKSAGKTGVLAQGGGKKTWGELEEEVKGIVGAGAKGLAIGRNVWQAEKPLDVAEKLSKLVYGRK
ncbi:aldolase [Patescibacteria group bacterium]|nr:aldolase [Patescibacteria group bacterium]